MVSIVSFAFALYFAAVLGISGFAKLERPRVFAADLRRNNILPEWSINSFSRLFPWVEIIIALMLVTGLASPFVAVFLLFLFASFLFVKLRLFAIYSRSYERVIAAA